MKLFHSAILVIVVSVFGMQVQAQDQEYNLDETFPVDENGTVHLQSSDAEVNIRGADRSDVHLVVYYSVEVDGWEIGSKEKFEMNVENRGGDLYIRKADTDGGRFIIGNVREEYRIDIVAPRNVALDISGDDDNYDISDFNSAIKLEADDTDIELSGMNGDDLEFDFDDGSLNMTEGQGSFKLNMDDGELFVRKAHFSEVDIQADDGEMNITTALSNDGFYSFDMDDGDLELNAAGGGGEFEIHHDDPDLRIGTDLQEVSSGKDHTVFRLPGGDARIEIETDDGDIALQTI